MKNYQFRPGWMPSLVIALLVPLFVALGFWQLHRAEEKAALMAQRELRLGEPALTSASSAWAAKENRYRRIELAGEFDAGHQFLLDNQIQNQQAGYSVLTPLHIEGSPDAVLVNRGWLPVGKDRTRLPDLAIKQTQIRLVGVIDQLPGVGFKLKGAEIPSSGWPSMVQFANAERLSERLGYRLLPYQVLLPPDAAEGYVRDWKPASLHPETSQGYALQWFSFALAALILYAWYGFKPKDVIPLGED
jgi:surfeit locus 1 family protein